MSAEAEDYVQANPDPRHSYIAKTGRSVVRAEPLLTSLVDVTLDCGHVAKTTNERKRIVEVSVFVRFCFACDQTSNLERVRVLVEREYRASGRIREPSPY